MIGYFILGVCLLAALLLAGQWFVNADPKRLAQTLRYGVVGVLGAVGLFLLITGRYAIGSSLLAFAYAVYRGLPGLGGPFGHGFARPSHGASGQASEVETDYLRMVLTHETGEMSGEVLKGPYAGKQLAELDLTQLVAVLSACQREDPDGARLLETYLDRTAGPDWRDAAGSAGNHQGGSGGEDRRRGAGSQMTVEEARQILGVGPEASKDDIKEAYRRLMQKLHPDQGGSTYLAAKVNQAKDLLLRLR